ncbi:MAG: ABC transporter ATP-binding protein, partial [Chloroflexaceae bacterium]|nr:ABC transporter ATP-binding protein [Chloroflexaceae bacterium]
HAYPHQLSGGMCQRVVIALALACQPRLLIADEPTTGLDVTIQQQIVLLLKELRNTMGTAQIVITHDLGMAAELCDVIAVMYGGSIVEMAPTVELFARPRHPYTIALLKSRPVFGDRRELAAIPGSVPDFVNPPRGCRFHPRCAYAYDRCTAERPVPYRIKQDHVAACFLSEPKGEL